MYLINNTVYSEYEEDGVTMLVAEWSDHAFDDADRYTDADSIFIEVELEKGFYGTDDQDRWELNQLLKDAYHAWIAERS